MQLARSEAETPALLTVSVRSVDDLSAAPAHIKLTLEVLAAVMRAWMVPVGDEGARILIALRGGKFLVTF